MERGGEFQRRQIEQAVRHPHRARLLDLLATNDLSLGPLAEMLGLSVSQVSYHLLVLEQAGLVPVRD